MLGMNFNLSAKTLVLLGFFLFCSTIFISIYKSPSFKLTNTIYSIFSSSLSSIFGFLLSSNINNYNNSKYEDFKYEVYDEIDDEYTKKNECKNIIKNRYKDGGNSVQVIVASLVTIILVLMFLLIYIFTLNVNIDILSQFRDLMCISIGFLLGEAKIKKR